MVLHSDGNAALAGRLAMEAFRNGVPNGEAVRLLGCNQPRAEARFAKMLTKAMDTANPLENSQGMMVSGDFGSGKSHLLAHLEHQALDRGFVCSKVVISKETPLYDLGKVYKSAVENGRIPDRSGRLIQELGQVIKPDSKAYAAFYMWANNAAANGLISPMFPASLLVHERSGDLELNGEIESFWAGDRILISRVKSGLRQIGQLQNFSFRAPKAADLPPQRLRFAIELIKGAGYKGWVILLDEIELIGSYSILQRGRSYAELARWLGQGVNETYPALVVVGTVTDDFASVIISPDGDKKDRDLMGPKLEGSRYKDITDHAEIGMGMLERKCEPLSPPSDDDVNVTVDKLRQLYSDTYDWDAPPLQGKAGGAGFRGRMRYKIRAAINEWDLLRLYPGSSPDPEIKEFRPGYDENVDLEREPQPDAGDA